MGSLLPHTYQKVIDIHICTSPLGQIHNYIFYQHKDQHYTWLPFFFQFGQCFEIYGKLQHLWITSWSHNCPIYKINSVLNTIINKTTATQNYKNKKHYKTRHAPVPVVCPIHPRWQIVIQKQKMQSFTQIANSPIRYPFMFLFYYSRSA